MEGRARGRARGRPQPREGQGSGGGGRGGNNSSRGGRGGARGGGNSGMGQVTQGVQRMGFGDNKRGRGGGGGRGRGGTKGRKRDDEQEFDCIRTKPEHIQSKKGTSGLEVALSTNFFGFQQKPDTRLFQYRVDFSLDEERTHMKKALVRQHNATLPQYMFDGSILLCFNRFAIY